jgi:hypothetical protein
MWSDGMAEFSKMIKNVFETRSPSSMVNKSALLVSIVYYTKM